MIKINPDSVRQTINYLETKFPNRLPRTITSIEKLHVLIGEQNVIQTLEELLEYLEQENAKRKN
jgi:hypothetical protein